MIIIKPIATNSFIIESGNTSLTIYETGDGVIELLPTQKFKKYEKISLELDHNEGVKRGLHDQPLDAMLVDRVRITGLVLQNYGIVSERHKNE